VVNERDIQKQKLLLFLEAVCDRSRGHAVAAAAGVMRVRTAARSTRRTGATSAVSAATTRTTAGAEEGRGGAPAHGHAPETAGGRTRGTGPGHHGQGHAPGPNVQAVSAEEVDVRSGVVVIKLHACLCLHTLQLKVMLMVIK
jgi:hypothetical protein